MDVSEKLNLMIENLETSRTEEDIVENLTKIVKNFSINQYSEKVLSNPYFKSLIPDVKKIILEEMNYFKDSIKEEITEIDNELKNPINSNSFDKLKSLRRDCVSLLYEIEQREKEIKLLQNRLYMSFYFFYLYQIFCF